MTLHAGANLSAILLRDGDFVACVYRGLVEDYSRQAVENIARKVFKRTRKEFSKLLIHVYERDITAWDYYCYGLYKGNSAFRDKFVSDFIRVALMKQIDAIPPEKCRLIEITACDFLEIDENTVLRREMVFALVQAQIQILALDYGRSLHQLYIGMAPAVHHAIANGASPA